jgi:hypothetical protein
MSDIWKKFEPGSEPRFPQLLRQGPDRQEGGEPGDDDSNNSRFRTKVFGQKFSDKESFRIKVFGQRKFSDKSLSQKALGRHFRQTFVIQFWAKFWHCINGTYVTKVARFFVPTSLPKKSNSSVMKMNFVLLVKLQKHTTLQLVLTSTQKNISLVMKWLCWDPHT